MNRRERRGVILFAGRLLRARWTAAWVVGALGWAILISALPVKADESPTNRSSRWGQIRVRGVATKTRRVRDTATNSAASHSSLAAENRAPASATPPGATGGAAGVDFDSLIDLITQTVAPDSWQDLGGDGMISPYPSGVLIDARGVLRRHDEHQLAARGRTIALQRPTQDRDQLTADLQHGAATLRKVSLPRLERAVAARLAEGQPLDEAMRCLGGLQRVDYVWVDDAQHELVLAGPADDWRIDDDGRLVGRTTGQPTLQLDDLVVLLRRAEIEQGSAFGCMITPRRESLAAAQAWLEATPASLPASQRTRWLEELRRRVGEQDIRVFGLDATTRVALVLVEADYRMKLLGLGLEPAPAGMLDYLDLLARHGDAAEPLEVLRWWFALAGGAPQASAARDVFDVRGNAVRVCCENELLDQGERIHTNRAAPLNQLFADEFTARFAQIAEQYPIYAELENICDLALVVQLIADERLAERAGWRATCFGDERTYRLARAVPPQTVDTVLSSRLVGGGRRIIASVSGGVRVDVRQSLEERPIETAPDDALRGVKSAAPPGDRWWWD